MKKFTRTNNGTAVVETLEGRTLMSSVTLANGVLTVSGNYNSYNNLSVKLTADNRVRGSANGSVKYVSATSVTSVKIVGGERTDNVYVDPRLAGKTNVQTFGGGDVMQAPIAASSNRMQVVKFSLINADTDKVIANFDNLGNGVTLNLAKLPTRNLNIVAHTINDQGGSVKFSLGGVTTVQNSGPYAIGNNTGSNYWKWTPKTGTFQLYAIPYTQDKAAGNVGIGKVITLNVIDNVNGPASSNPGSGTVTAPAPVPSAPAPAPKPTPAPAPAPAPVPEPDPIPDDNDAEAPLPLITAIDRSVPLGHAIHVHALNSGLKTGTVLNARYQWDFGDDGSKYDQLNGFNAAHVYSKPGTYTITLKVTNSAGKSASVTTNVTVTAANRRVIYVSNDGNDSNSGLSAASPIRTLARASAMVADDTEILFNRGDTFTFTGAGMKINGGSNIVIGAYGTGNRPVLRYTGAETSGWTDIIAIGDSQDVLVRDLTFDSHFGPDTGKTHVNAVRVGGQNITIRGNQVLNIDDFVNNNGTPRGELVMDNVAPLSDGLRGQFVWIEGSDHVILGNKVANSSHENVIRGSVYAARILIAHNDLANPDLGRHGDQKTAVAMQKVSYAYVANNIIRDCWVGFGPLGNADGLEEKAGRLTWAILENNTLYNSYVTLDHGTTHASLRGNVFHKTTSTAIWIDGYHTTYERGVEDVYIHNNTVVNSGTDGQFLRVGGPAKYLSVTNNLFVAPNIQYGYGGSAAVSVATSDLSCFRTISGNVWPDSQTRTGGVVIVGGVDTYITDDQWEAYTQVRGDVFRDVTLGSTYQYSLGGTMVGSALARAA